MQNGPRMAQSMPSEKKLILSAAAPLGFEKRTFGCKEENMSKI